MAAPNKTAITGSTLENESDKPSAGDQETLKYQLLGPSLTKAGQDAVDQQKVSEIIYNASKGSKFFHNEEARDRILTQKVQRILAYKSQLEKTDLSRELRRADDYLAELEVSRDLTQSIVHIDCDAFYAAVEELDRPELKHVPMAVGKGVITTCNYHARKFGCRSGMAAFVAMKLCPTLICLPLNFEKYTAKAQEVRAVLSNYDPRFESVSIDEAYINITKYCKDHQLDPETAVARLRAEVEEKTKITVSAGIAPNARLAKIASNKNKPNGQYRVPSSRSAVMEFMHDLPVRKVNGVGRVFERELDAVGIHTCGDIYAHRAYLAKLFGEKAFQFLAQCYLGLGRTSVQPAEEHERKSIGTESTFQDMSGPADLRNKLRRTAEELSKDLARTQFKGRTLVLKVKLHTYEILTRQAVLPKAVNLADDLYHFALPMLTKLEKEIPGLKLRLMGLRVTNLVSLKKNGLDFFSAVRSSSPHTPPEKRKASEMDDLDSSDWQAWREDEFEFASDPLEPAYSDGLHGPTDGRADVRAENTAPRRHGKEITPNPKREKNTPLEAELWDCPICLRPQAAEHKQFNDHIDFCLSRQTIKEAVKDSTKAIPSRNKGIYFARRSSSTET